jgi:hypothetical protein
MGLNSGGSAFFAQFRCFAEDPMTSRATKSRFTSELHWFYDAFCESG